MGWIVAVPVAVVVVLAAAAAAFVVGMRTRNRWVQDALMAFTKSVANPRTLHTAGGPGASASLIRHRGRTSGQTYETPVGAVAVAGGFLVSMPYGMRPNWIRNVLAAGGATLVHEGVEHPVVRPEVVPLAPVVDAFAPSDRTLHRVFGVRECLSLQTASEAAAAA